MTVSGNSAPRSPGESVDLAAQVGRVAAPLRQQVLDVLRQAILSFHYAPGQRLVERELIEEIGVSRTTIREALRELAAEGLVKTIPQKGAVVVVPSLQEALELYELRAALEALAVRRFTEVASDDQVAELRAAFEQLAEVANGDGDTLRILQAKGQFYDVLLRGCGNRSVHSTLGGVQARLSLLRATSLAQPGRTARSVQELRAMVEAIEARNPEAAVRACNHHIEQAKRAGLEGLSATSGLPFSSASL
ncbi:MULTISPECIES: GntR family transcriptional regulator [Streptomyces]|uniref:GntR family transcriptional regulator n=1 Tax=Streptomyces TaxID=1883 RepID=UPI0005EDDA7D|nr:MULTISPECIES: GntR family transcriptional regulator [unclassified Streptomyces]UJV45379.1 GntR family transcriptional regulator [Streptomyces sp. AMCC400023]